MDLIDLKSGQQGRVVKVISPAEQTHKNEALIRRLMEIGFIPGTVVMAMHHAPLSQDPISVTVRGMHVALRRNEAKLVHIELISSPAKNGDHL